MYLQARGSGKKGGKSVKRYRSSARVDIQQAVTARGFIEHIKSSFIGNNSDCEVDRLYAKSYDEFMCAIGINLYVESN